jgi:hypothetical protein
VIDMPNKKVLNIKDRECVSCGKKFDVEIEADTSHILTDCFYGGKIRLGIGNWSAYQMIEDENGNTKLERIIPWYRVIEYKLIDLKNLIFHNYKDVEYWECSECKLKGDMEFAPGYRKVIVEMNEEDGERNECT